MCFIILATSHGSSSHACQRCVCYASTKIPLGLAPLLEHSWYSWYNLSCTEVVLTLWTHLCVGDAEAAGISRPSRRACSPYRRQLLNGWLLAHQVARRRESRKWKPPRCGPLFHFSFLTCALPSFQNRVYLKDTWEEQLACRVAGRSDGVGVGVDKCSVVFLREKEVFAVIKALRSKRKQSSSFCFW